MIKFVHFDGTLRGLSQIRKHFRCKGSVITVSSASFGLTFSEFQKLTVLIFTQFQITPLQLPGLVNPSSFVTKYHSVFCTVSALSVPSCPVSHRRSSCLTLSDSARFGRLPVSTPDVSFQALSCLYGTLHSLQYHIHNLWFVSNAQCHDESLSNYRVHIRTRPVFSSQPGILQLKHSVLSQGCRQYHGFHSVGIPLEIHSVLSVLVSFGLNILQQMNVNWAVATNTFSALLVVGLLSPWVG